MRKMKGEKGFTLIGVLVAIAILGLVAVIFAGGISTAAKAVFVSDERATAESLAKSQLESVKSQLYIIAPASGESTYAPISGDIPPGYAIGSINRDGNAVSDIIGVPWDSDEDQPAVTDEGLQKIELIIDHHDKLEVITLEGYKVNR